METGELGCVLGSRGVAVCPSDLGQRGGLRISSSCLLELGRAGRLCALWEKKEFQHPAVGSAAQRMSNGHWY